MFTKFNEKYVIQNRRLPFYLRTGYLISNGHPRYYTIKEFSNRNGKWSRLFYLAYIFLFNLFIGVLSIYGGLKVLNDPVYNDSGLIGLIFAVVGLVAIIHFVMLIPFALWLVKSLKDS